VRLRTMLSFRQANGWRLCGRRHFTQIEGHAPPVRRGNGRGRRLGPAQLGPAGATPRVLCPRYAGTSTLSITSREALFREEVQPVRISRLLGALHDTID